MTDWPQEGTEPPVEPEGDPPPDLSEEEREYDPIFNLWKQKES